MRDLRRHILEMRFLLALAPGLVQGQAPDIAGEWSVVRSPAVGPPSSPAEDWIRSLPTAVYSLTDSAIPPLAMVRKDLGYTYFPSQPTITILAGTPDKPYALGFLQSRAGRGFEGELASGGCWIHLSLEESEDGSILSGSARNNVKISTRQCRSSLVKAYKNGAPFDYALTRLR
jgi:hypothetical protein